MEKKLRIGVFGTWRGNTFVKALAKIEEAEVVALLDKDESKIQDALPYCKKDVKVCRDFEELLSCNLDAVVLANYFNEHAPYAIKALKAGVNVFSETTPAYTLKECVELVEAVEESGKTYALAENYPFYRANREITRLFQSGIMGNVIFAEGEYVHPMSPAEHSYFTPDPKHWRNGLPCTYYCTHAMAPLMAATGLVPRKVIGKVCYDNGDNGGILLCEMSNGAVFRTAGDMCMGYKGNWYRLSCQNGNLESVRGDENRVRLALNPWCCAEAGQAAQESIYLPAPDPLEEKARGADHGGSDFFCTYQFVQDLLHHREPFMNVYRAVTLSAMGILGWRSALNNSVQLDIPDFTKKEDRDKVRNDIDAPQYHYGAEANIPNYLY